MDSLTQTFNDLREKIIRLKKRDQPIGEANTKATLIEPLLAALGWNTTNIDEVVREFKLSQRYNPVDYALLLDKEPCLFIEAKALKHSLDDVKWVKQTVNYANNAGVEWCVLTNGDDYHIYRSNAPVSLEKKLFRRVKITESYSEAMEVLALLAKENLTKGTLNSQWDTYFARTILKEALVEVLQAPPPALVKAVKEKTSLKPSLIRSLLGDARIQVELPKISGTPSSQKHRKAKFAFQDVTLRNLINKGLLKPPCRIFAVYHKERLEATIERDGSVVFQSNHYKSLSLAGGCARNSVIGPPKDGRKYYQTNGWTFWRIEDEEGKTITLHKLREQASRT